MPFVLHRRGIALTRLASILGIDLLFSIAKAEQKKSLFVNQKYKFSGYDTQISYTSRSQESVPEADSTNLVM